MTSNNIYTSEKPHPSTFDLNTHTSISKVNLLPHTPYTYLIGWSKHNKWYYGSRHAINCHPSELFNTELLKSKRYETSSNTVKEYIKTHGYPDIIQIRRTFTTSKGAVKCESIVLSKVLVKYKDIYLNKNFGSHQLIMLGKVAVKDKEGNVFLTDLTDPRYISRELRGVNHGTVSVIDTDGKCIKVYVTDPRYISGELKSNSVGKLPVKDSKGNQFRVSITDPRYISGGLQHTSTGRINAILKDGSIESVYLTDPRFDTKEIVKYRATNDPKVVIKITETLISKHLDRLGLKSLFELDKFILLNYIPNISVNMMSTSTGLSPHILRQSLRRQNIDPNIYKLKKYSIKTSS